VKVILADTRYCQALKVGIQSHIPEVEFSYVKPDGEIIGDVCDAQIFIAWGLEGDLIERVINDAIDLRWFHLMSAGVESLMFPALRESDIALTNARGVFAIPVAESVLAVMLCAAKNLRGNFEDARKHIWRRQPHIELNGATAGILGMGRIGSEVARMLQAMGMNVVGLKRRPDQSPSVKVEKIFSPHELHEFLVQCDWVIICAALTPQTRKMLGETEFRRMKPTAWLVNVARGEIADDQALLQALDEGSIYGACLDAFTEEPLPDSSPFWDHPKVIMTPHNSSESPNTVQRNLSLVFENLERYMEGRELINTVDKVLGY
jgi:phosphoglycerate dehydrogenase-like enzyme